MSAKAGKKQRKWHRNGRKPGASLQTIRTARNKLRRVNHQRRLAGWPLFPTLPTVAHPNTGFYPKGYHHEPS